MLKKIVIFIASVLALAVCYGFVYWLLNIIFDSNNDLNFKELLVQSVVFGIIYVAISTWLRKRKKKES